MADLAKIILPSGDEYNFKDAQAREKIQSEINGETSTVTGDFVTFETESAQVLPSVVVDIDPVQDLHGYDHPWPAGGGKNLLPISPTASSQYWTNNNDGSWTVNNSSTGSGNIYPSGTTKFMSMGVLPAGTYTASTFSSREALSDIVTVRIGKGENSTFLISAVGSVQFEADGTSEYWFAMLISGSTIASNHRVWLQCEKASTATDYAPYSNICPISGWDGCEVERAGKNLFDADSANFKDGYYLDSSGIEQSHSYYKYTQTYMDILPSTTYCIQAYNNSGNVPCMVCLYDSNKRFLERVTGYSATSGEGIKSGSFTTSASAHYIRFSLYRQISNIMLEIASTASPYEPYQNSTYSISFPSSAGTVYGGTLDFTNGVLTITHGAKQVPAVKSHISSVSSSGETVSFWIYVPGLVAGTSDDTPICDTLKNHHVGSISALSLNEFSWSTSYPNSFFCRMSTTLVGTTLDSIWAYLKENPLTVCSQLSAPVTYQLTPKQVTALLGQNNLWADTGDSTVIYRTGKLALLSDIVDSEERVREDLNDRIDSLTAVDVGAQSAIKSGTISFSLSWNTQPIEPGDEGHIPYEQIVTVTGVTVTANSLISLQPAVSQLMNLMEDGVTAIAIENDNGTLTAYALGAAPSTAMTIACTVTEVTT